MKLTSTQLESNERANLLKVLRKLSPNAVYSSDLTTDVTVLVANPARTNQWLRSPKYLHVVKSRPDVRIVRYEGVLKAYERWIRGDDHIPIEDIECVSVFDGLQLCIGRIDEGSIGKLKQLSTRYGATMTEALSESSAALVTTEPSGRRYDKCQEWGIPVVSPDWIYDSVERGHALNTVYYKLKRPNSHGEKDAACDWDKLRRWRERKRERHAMQKKRTSEVEDDDGPRDLKVAKIDTRDKLWNSIMSTISRNSIKETPEPEWDSEQKVDDHTEIQMTQPEVLMTQPSEPDAKKTMLAHTSMQLVGPFTPAEKVILKKVIEECGGSVDGADPTYSVVNLTRQESPGKGTYITELGLERALYFQDGSKLLDVWGLPLFKDDSNGSCQHVREALGIPDVSDKRISVAITGFQGINLSQIEKLLKVSLLKEYFNFHESFSKDCELLLVEDPRGDNSRKKIRLSKKWNVYVVDLTRFWDAIGQCVRTC